MSDLNPNTPVVDTPAPDIGSGEGPVTFDELEAIMDKDAKASKKSEAKESKESKETKPKELSKDKSDDKKETPKDKKAGEKEEKDPVEEIKKKTFKAKLQDKELDLDEDAIFKVKVNGQEVDVALKDIVTNYSGKVAWDKKFSEVAKIQQEVRQANEELGKNKALIKSIFTESNPELRLFKMAELAGVNPLEFRQAYFDENLKMLENYSGMSEDERKAADLEFENKYLRHQTETTQRETSFRQTQEVLDKRVQNLMATHGFDKGEFVEYYDRVNALADKDGNVIFRRQGREVQEKLTPELISEIIVKERLWNTAEAKIGELKLGWQDAQKNKFLLDLVENAYSHGMKESDLPDVINELWGSKRSQKAVKEKLEEKEAFKTGTKPRQEAASSSSEALFFDDLT